MGSRGNTTGDLAKIRNAYQPLSLPPPPLPPSHLDRLAKEFWERNYDHLVANDMLAISDFDSFVLLCQTYSMLQYFQGCLQDNPKLMRQWLDLNKRYCDLARMFALMPTARKKLKLQTTEQAIEEVREDNEF